MTIEQVNEAVRFGFNVLIDEGKRTSEFDAAYVLYNGTPNVLYFERFIETLGENDEIIFYNDDYVFEDGDIGGHYKCEYKDKNTYLVTVSKKDWIEMFEISVKDLLRVIVDTWDHEDYEGMYYNNILIMSKKS